MESKSHYLQVDDRPKHPGYRQEDRSCWMNSLPLDKEEDIRNQHMGEEVKRAHSALTHEIEKINY